MLQSFDRCVVGGLCYQRAAHRPRNRGSERKPQGAPKSKSYSDVGLLRPGGDLCPGADCRLTMMSHDRDGPL